MNLEPWQDLISLYVKNPSLDGETELREKYDILTNWNALKDETRKDNCAFLWWVGDYITNFVIVGIFANGKLHLSDNLETQLAFCLECGCVENLNELCRGEHRPMYICSDCVKEYDWRVCDTCGKIMYDRLEPLYDEYKEEIIHTCKYCRDNSEFMIFAIA